MENDLHNCCFGIGTIEPYMECLDSMLNGAKCRGDDKFGSLFLAGLSKDKKSSLSHIHEEINKLTVNDIRFYSTALIDTAKAQCAHDPDYLSDHEKFKKTIECMNVTIGVNTTATRKNIERMQEMSSKLLGIDWFTNGKPLSSLDCQIITDLLDTMKNVFSLPSCLDYVTYTMTFVKKFQKLICEERF